MRKRRTAERREALAAEHGWICNICKTPINPVHQSWHLDHVQPIAVSADDTDENLRPVHATCHIDKTRVDVTAIAKTKRIRAKHIGTARKAKPMAGSRRSQWKRHMDGTVSRRDGQ